MPTLAEPEALADLSPAARDAWNEWVRREKTQALLDRVDGARAPDEVAESIRALVATLSLEEDN